MRAVIDIGSNSVRLLIDRGAFSPKKIATTQLSEGLTKANILQEIPIARTAKAVQSFVTEALSSGADPIYIFATEAVRSASNSLDFVRLIERNTSIAVDVLSEEVESLTGFLGAKVAGKTATIDIGGASVEICVGGEKIEYSRSLPLGVVRLKETCDLPDLPAYLESKLAGYLTVPKADNYIAIGGTATSLGAMLQRLTIYDTRKVHGYKVAYSALAELIENISPLSSLEEYFPTLDFKRATVIKQGAITLQKIMQYLDISFVTVSESDNLEGYLKYIDNGRKM